MAENNAKAPEQESNFKALVLPVIVLVVICLVCSALLAVLNDATAPIIEANTKAETLAAYLSVLPEGTTADDLQDVTVTTANVTGAVKTRRHGCCEVHRSRLQRQPGYRVRCI